MMKFQTTRRMVLFGGAAVALTGCAGVLRSARREGGPIPLAPGTRIVVVRHMDRFEGDLSELGRARAAALPGAIADIPLDAIYTNNIPRNIDSTVPLAEARGIDYETLPGPRIHTLLPEIAAGQSVIWIGNSDNLVAIWDAFGLPGDPPTTYGDIAVITPGADGRAVAARRRVEASVDSIAV